MTCRAVRRTPLRASMAVARWPRTPARSLEPLAFRIALAASLLKATSTSEKILSLGHAARIGDRRLGLCA
eukprot:4649946-Pyramimonas_sp.AAC.1